MPNTGSTTTERPRLVLASLTGVNVLNYFDRYVPAAVLPLIILRLHLTDFHAGALHWAFIVVYAVASPLAGWMGDRSPRLRLAAVGVFIWSLATFASGLAPTFAVLFLVRALVGIGEAGYAAVTPSVIADLYPADRRASALAIFYAAIPVGSAAGYIIGGWVGTSWGYPQAFYVAGGPGLLVAAGLFLLREPRRGAFDRASAQDRPLVLRDALRALAARRSYIINTVAQTVYAFSMGGLAVWMPTYFVRQRGLPLDRANFIFGGVLSLSGFLGTLVGGRVGDRLARRTPGAHFSFSGWALMASLPFTVIAVMAPRPVFYWPAMFMTLFLLFLNTGPLNAAMTNVLPSRLRGQGFGLYALAIHLLGDAISPPLIGLVSDHTGGLRLPVLLTGLLLVPAGALLLWGRRALARDLETAGAESTS